MDESHEEFAKSKTPVTKCHILYDSFYMKCSEKAHLYTSASTLVVARSGSGNRESLQMSLR